MKKVLAIAAVALAFAPTSVSAQERVGHAALGAVSGAVVLGPVGAVAGGVIGCAQPNGHARTAFVPVAVEQQIWRAGAGFGRLRQA